MDRRALMLATGGLFGAVGAAQLTAAPSAVAAGTDAATGPVFDVRAYGAVGDGVTDDTAAFRRALAAAREVPGGGATLLVPAGSYPL
ncbi:glycosyl hydrolase family 28-related protein, partial [Streptomyces violaceoruber]